MTETPGKIFLYHSALPTKRRRSKIPRKGYDLVADPAGAQRLMAAVKAVRGGATQTLELDSPERRLSDTTGVMEQLTLELAADLPALVVEKGRPQRGPTLQMRIEGTHMHLVLSKAGLYEFEEGIQDLAQGDGNYALWGEGPDEGIWFWDF